MIFCFFAKDEEGKCEKGESGFMSAGRIILVLAGLLAAFGVCQRVLDRMRLTDRQALLIVFSMFLGSFLPDLAFGRVNVNIGGCVIPVLVSLYLFVKASDGFERVRAVSASLASAALMLALGRFFPDEPETMPFDINYLYGIAAGVLAALIGRSRRSAFIAGAVGIVLADLADGISVMLRGIDQTVRIGSGGILDTVVLSAVGAVIAAELIGEFRERCARGGAKDPSREFENGEIVGRNGK